MSLTMKQHTYSQFPARLLKSENQSTDLKHMQESDATNNKNK